MAVNDEAATQTELDAATAQQLIDGGAELIDVRREYEWEGGHLAGARQVEINELTAASDTIARDRPVIFYCRGGNRSQMAAEAFRQAGFDAHSLAGGIEAWVAGGHPIEPPDGEVRAPLPPS